MIQLLNFMLKLLNIYLQSINYDARELAVTSGMNTASGDSGGTGGSSESSVADVSHKLVSPINPDRWVYNTDELIRYPQRRKQPSVVWAHFKLYKCHEKRGYEGFADKAWCDHCHKAFVKENSTLLRHLQRHHKNELHDGVAYEETSMALAHNESTLKSKKGHIEQFFSAKSVRLVTSGPVSAVWFNYATY